MKKTFEDVFMYAQVASKWLKNNPTGFDKFRYGLTKVGGQTDKLQGEHQTRQEDINIEYCAVEEKTGIILKDDKGEFRFTKQGLRDRNKALLALMKEEVDIDPHYVNKKDLPKLAEFEVEILTGFVIESQPLELVKEAENA